MHVARITRYPLKGLNGEDLEAAAVIAGVGIPGDRALGLKLAGAPPGWQGKHLFLQLVNTPALARLRIRFDEATERLEVFEGRERLLAAEGVADAANVEAFFAGFVAQETGRFRPLRLERERFPDAPGFDLSLVFQATLDDLGRRAGRPLAAERFRMNLVIGGDDARPFGEWDLVGRALLCGDARLRACERLPRCPAIHVDPASGARDADVLGLLERELGHQDVGIMLKVESGGRIAVGDSLAAAAGKPPL